MLWRALFAAGSLGAALGGFASALDLAVGLGLALLAVGFTGGLGSELYPLGVIYLQLGRFAGVESLYGWELYDRVLRLTTDSLRADLDTSPLKTRLLSLQFNGADGFYLLFDLPARPNGSKNGARLEDEARRFRDGTVKRLRQSLGRTAVDLMSVHASCIKVPDDPRVRPSRHILRGLQEAARLLGARETQEKQELLSEFRGVMTGRKLRAVFQQVMDISRKSVLGYEALIR